METKIFILIAILILCNLSSCVTAGSYQKSDTLPSDEKCKNQNIPIPSFHQYIDYRYDHNIVKNASYIPGGPPVYIPFNISYWTDLPDVLLKIPFKYLMNLFLFGKVSRIQTINLKVLNEPDWAVITFSNANLSFEIDNDKQFAYTDLLITCLEKAPSTGYFLEIQIDASSLRLLNAYACNTSLSFIPQYVPCLRIDWDVNVSTSPLEKTNISINITNCGNWETRVRAYLLEYPNNWVFIINPLLVNIAIDQTQPMTLTVIPPKDFHGIETIKLQFTTERYPSLGETGEPYIIRISVHYP